MVAAEQLCSAGPALIHALGLGLLVLAGPWRFRACVAQHGVFLRGELFAPLGVGLDDLGCHTLNRIHVKYATRASAQQGGEDERRCLPQRDGYAEQDEYNHEDGR